MTAYESALIELATLERYLGSSEAAYLLGLSLRTTQRLLQTGVLAGYRVADTSHWLISPEALVAFAAARGLPLRIDTFVARSAR